MKTLALLALGGWLGYRAGRGVLSEVTVRRHYEDEGILDPDFVDDQRAVADLQ